MGPEIDCFSKNLKNVEFFLVKKVGPGPVLGLGDPIWTVFRSFYAQFGPEKVGKTPRKARKQPILTHFGTIFDPRTSIFGPFLASGALGTVRTGLFHRNLRLRTKRDAFWLGGALFERFFGRFPQKVALIR